VLHTRDGVGECVCARAHSSGGVGRAAPDAGDDDANIAWVKDTFGALAPYTADSVYVNYMADDDTARVQAAYGPCWDRLRQVKRTYDPDNLFRVNQNIKPA